MSLQNIDRRPPTLLKHFTIQQSWRSPLPRIPSHLYALPNPSHPTASLVSTSPLCSFELDLINFFDDQPTGLRLTAQFLDRISAEESEISRFVRTPEGQGLGVIRKGGGGETWSHGPAEAMLTRSASWSAADRVVVLDHGTCSKGTFLKTDSNFHRSSIRHLFELGIHPYATYITSYLCFCSSSHLVVHDALQ